MAVAHGLQSRDIELNAQLVRRQLIVVAELQQHSYDTVRLFAGGKSFHPQILSRGIDPKPGPAAKRR